MSSSLRLEYSFLSGKLAEILIARSDKGLVAVMLGEDQHTLADALKERFPSADTSLVVDGLHTEKASIEACMQGESTAEALSLDLQGTDFQLTVWRALMRIPFGSTMSYQQLADRAGRPTATRAVASACGANPLAIVVPCHRVIRQNGDLGGYHWGLETKRQLLALEQQIQHRQQTISATN